MPPKKHTSAQDKKRIYDAHMRGEDAMLLGRQLSIKENTVRAMIRTISARNGKISVKQGGSHYMKVTSEMKTKIEEIISENCTLTLPEINLRLQKEQPNEERITTKTIERILNGLFYTVKDTVVHPYERNCQRIKDAREEYAEFSLETGILTAHHIFIDKTGFNVWTKRGKGRSKKGVPATLVTHGQRGQNITLILAISPQLGVVHHDLVDGV